VAANAECPQLREYRLQLGWTQQEMADRIAHLAWMERRERAGVNADMVAKWERGVKGISPRYRELLCHLFGVTPDQLGLKNVLSAGAERVPAKVDDQSLVAMLDNAAGLLDQLGAAGTALAPHMLHAWKEAVTTRRTMLGLLDPSATDPIGHARATTATVADLEQLTERYQALHDTADPAALLTSVAAHVRMAQDTLRQDLPTDMRRRLLRNLAEVAILAGQLAADDLGNTMSGRAYYGLALDAAREVADDQLTAIAHGHTAQLAAAEGLTMAALDHLTAGNDMAVPPQPSPAGLPPSRPPSMQTGTNTPQRGMPLTAHTPSSTMPVAGRLPRRVATPAPRNSTPRPVTSFPWPVPTPRHARSSSQHLISLTRSHVDSAY
jgi:transcriptional regulator with XRE-family HTH domain